MDVVEVQVATLDSLTGAPASVRAGLVYIHEAMHRFLKAGRGGTGGPAGGRGGRSSMRQ
jgi:hypothetical protein